MTIKDQEKKLLHCPHCGKHLYPDSKYDTRFHTWGTVAIVLVLSLMLFAIDLTSDGIYENWSIDWAHLASLGVWIFYITTQMMRNNHEYAWIMIPVSGILFSFFFYSIDRLYGANKGFMETDWAWFVIIPIVTFVVLLPILGRFARKRPGHYQQLEYLVESIESELGE